MGIFKHKELSYKVLGMAYTVHNLLGSGLLEHAYRESMCVELEIAGIPHEREKVYTLEYKGRNVGTYFADICFAASRQSSSIFTVVKILQSPFFIYRPWKHKLSTT